MEHFHLCNNFKYFLDETILFQGEMRVRVWRKHEKARRNMASEDSFASVPRVFGWYCSSKHSHMGKTNTYLGQ